MMTETATAPKSGVSAQLNEPATWAQFAFRERFNLSKRAAAILLSSATAFCVFVIAAVVMAAASKENVRVYTCDGSLRIQLGVVTSLASTLAVILMIFALLFEFLFLRNQEKDFIAGYIFTMIPLALCLQVLTYALYGEVEHRRDYNGGGGLTRFFQWFIFALIMAFVGYVFALCTLSFHWFFAATIDGPTLSDYFNVWRRKMVTYIKYGPEGLAAVKRMMTPTPVVKVREAQEEYYVELNLTGWTYADLVDAVSKHYDCSPIDISTILKGGDTVVQNDDDVGRLDRFSRLEILIDRTQPNFLSHEDTITVEPNFSLDIDESGYTPSQNLLADSQ